MNKYEILYNGTHRVYLNANHIKVSDKGVVTLYEFYYSAFPFAAFPAGSVCVRIAENVTEK